MARMKQGATGDSHNGRPREGQRTVNPPTESGSTILYKNCRSFVERTETFHYGRLGTSTHWAFEDSLAQLEGAEGVYVTPSGIAAITVAVLSFAQTGGHVLIPDSAYDPTRAFADSHLSKMGIETTYYDPTVGSEIAQLIRPNTFAILCESPGSLTFEIQDIPAIIKAAGEIPVIVDNTWASGVYLKPLAMGAAISLQAITKYIGGHSDLLMGAICCRDKTIAHAVGQAVRSLGNSVSARDVALAHRGMRTLHRRLQVHHQSGIEIAQWLEQHPSVTRVIHPALPSHPQHDLWKRDFTGASGLFSFMANWTDKETTIAFVDALELYGIGYSWGGFESLCIPAWPHRTTCPWQGAGQLFRLHIGLEETSDLMEDLNSAFKQVA